MRALLLLLMSLGITPAVVAHDFWVQPSGYWLTPEATVALTLQVGHGPYRQRSPIQLSRVLRFAAIGPQESAIDLRSQLHPGQPREDGNLQLRAPGTYVLALETDDHAQSHLPALRFNDYLRVEGLTPALVERQRTHSMDSDGSENYSRCAKAIVQVGPALPGFQAMVTRPVGLPLEIVPEVSPYAQPRPAQLPVRVLYEGRPLEGALIKLTNLAHDEAPVETHLSDRKGRAVFALPARGAWLLNIIWTKPLPSSRETDFTTVFSSLSFGFP